MKLIIENLHKLYGNQIKWKRQTLKFGKGHIIDSEFYKIPITYQSDYTEKPIESWIIIYRTDQLLTIGNTTYEYKLTDLQTVANFCEFIGNLFFPNGHIIIK